MKRCIADLHIHTCLSPCAEVDMTPRRIVEKARAQGLDIIALSDHNSAENIQLALDLAKEENITVLPAMEVTSREEAHVLALFRSAESATAMQEIVYRALPAGVHDEQAVGYQLIVNERDEIMEFNKRLLFSATGLTAREIIDAIHALGGLAIACHIDREHFSVVSQLGFISDDLSFDALEISRATGMDRARSLFSAYASFPWITSSDAHQLADIGSRTTAFFLNEPSFEEIALAFKGERKIEWNQG
ncbi:MAG: PHP domain-containing protein [Nitrospirota bacterium]